MRQKDLHNDLDIYESYKNKVMKYLITGEKQKSDLCRYLGFSEIKFEIFLSSVSSSWPIYEDEKTYRLGWLK